MANSRSKSRSYDEENYDYSNDGRKEYEYDPRYNDNISRKHDGGCCSCSKAIVFFLFLGGGLGLFFGFTDMSRVEDWFASIGGGGNTGSVSTNSTENGPPFQFDQCSGNQLCCNGLESNCDLRLNEMAYATLHNANSHDFLGNHEAPFEGALEVGYRGLMFDICRCDNEIVFCHGDCLLGNRDPTEVFTNVDTFLNDNPHEIIIFNFQFERDGTNSPQQSELWDLIEPMASFRRKVLNFNGGTWPTPKEMLDNQKQVVLFQHNSYYLCPTGTEIECAPRIENYFEYVLESNWDFLNVDQVQDSQNSCPGTRGVDGSRDFYSINNFVTSLVGPSKAAASIINEKTALSQRVAECEALTGHQANFINIDFWQSGDTVEVAQSLNIVRARRRRRYLSRVFQWLGLD